MKQGKNIPEWLHKTGKPILWTFRAGSVTGPRVVSQGIVRHHQAGRVYVVGTSYGLWFRSEDIEPVVGHNDGEFLP